MYALVLFSDDRYYICKSTDIIEKNGEFIIRYKGSRYTGNVVEYNANKQKLMISKKKLENEMLNEENISKQSEDNQEIRKRSMNFEKDLENNIAELQNVPQPSEDNQENLRIHPSFVTPSMIAPEANCDNDSQIVSTAFNDQKIDTWTSSTPDNKSPSSHQNPDNMKIVSVKVFNEQQIISANASHDIVDESIRLYDTVSSNNISIMTELTAPATDLLQNFDTFVNTNNSYNYCNLLNIILNIEKASTNDEELAWDAAFPPVYNDTNISDGKNYGHDECSFANHTTSHEGGNNTYTITSLSTVQLSSDTISGTVDIESNRLFDGSERQLTADASFEDVLTLPGFSLANAQEDEEHLNVISRDSDVDENGNSSSFKGSDYAPELDESSHSSDDESIRGRMNTTETPNNSAIDKSTDLEASLLINKVGHSAPDDNEMFVETVETGNKKDFCIYCKTQQGKLSRHLARKHREEEDVAQFLSFDKGSEERKKLISAIRKKGAFYFNTNRAVNTGERKVARRPNAQYQRNATDFATCPTCLADYAKNSLRHHSRRCEKRNNTSKRSILLRSKKLIGRIHPQASDVLRSRVFPSLQEDNIVKTIRYDELIILFGNKLCQKYKDPHFYDMIRQKLRQLGRFLVEMRKINGEITDLFSIFFPKNYDSVISAIQSLAGINDSETGFKVPSLATSLGTLIKQVGKLCISEFIKRQNKAKQTFAEDFLKLLAEDYSTAVARTALETQTRNKRQKKTLLPSRDDINKLNIYLRNEVQKNFRITKKKFCLQAWLDLGAAVLLTVELFNRRRPGEMERTLIEDFLSHKKIDERSVGEVYNNFSVEEKKAAQKYVRFEIRGKLLRDVGVLMDRELLLCVKLILSQREEAGVNVANPYVFGIPGTLKGDYRYHHACALLRRYAQECGAEKPETLRWTNLRKHVATMCINFDLTEGEVSDLANFMGHADQIHKRHYRQPIITREIIHISKLLEAVQGNENSSGETDVSDDEVANASGEIGPLSTRTDLVETVDRGHTLSDHDVSAKLQNKSQKKKRSTSPYGKCSRVPWSVEEKEVAIGAFGSLIAEKKLPSFQQIQAVVDKNSGVFKRNVATIKTWLHNQMKKKN